MINLLKRWNEGCNWTYPGGLQILSCETWRPKQNLLVRVLWISWFDMCRSKICRAIQEALHLSPLPSAPRRTGSISQSPTITDLASWHSRRYWPVVRTNTGHQKYEHIGSCQESTRTFSQDCIRISGLPSIRYSNSFQKPPELISL